MEMDEDSYYARVQSAYDGIATQYDNSVGKSAVSRRAKQLALQTVKDVTPAGGSLLDIGCYTGIEALQLAQEGFRVAGADLPPAMSRIAEAEARQRRLQGYVQLGCL